MSGARHYLDHASSSPLRPEAAAVMRAWIDEGPFGDPGRVHADGHASRALVEESRDEVAALFGTRPRQVVFTSGATEAIAAATWSALSRKPGGVVIHSAVEHSAVRDSAQAYAPRFGSAVREVGADRAGKIAVDEVMDAVAACGGGDGVALVHCQAGNHEVGTLQPVAEITAACGTLGVPVHVDAAAAAGVVALDVAALGAKYLSVSSHKLGGPPGAGALVLGAGVRMTPLLHGGRQERARRGGMENLAGITGFGAVARVLGRPGVIGAEAAAARAWAERLAAAALASGDAVAYGDPDPAGRLAHIVCAGVEGVEAEALLIALDQEGIAAHSGSACSSESLEPSPVLAAMGVDADRSLRLSVGWSTTEDDVAAFERAWPEVVDRLRGLGGW